MNRRSFLRASTALNLCYRPAGRNKWGGRYTLMKEVVSGRIVEVIDHQMEGVETATFNITDAPRAP